MSILMLFMSLGKALNASHEQWCCHDLGLRSFINGPKKSTKCQLMAIKGYNNHCTAPTNELHVERILPPSTEI